VTVPDAPPPEFLATAIEAVLQAGDIQLASFGGDLEVGKKGAIDLVTNIDLEIERRFRAMIAERFPDHVVLGEEFEQAGQRDAIPEYCWVFDPIDGTTNYAHGLPIFCCSVALEVRGVPVAAAVYDPTRKELFTAERGQGARLNGRPLRVSGNDRVIDALLVTGFHYDVHRDPGETMGLFARFVGAARAVRRLGSAALDLCYVAAGRFEGFWEQRLQPWDIAGGALIVQEAGGRVTTVTGGPYASRAGSVLATNGLVHDEMLDLIRDFRRESDASRGLSSS
jgi:myo-inositol-1(or 4)-monophosphatase